MNRSSEFSFEHVQMLFERHVRFLMIAGAIIGASAFGIYYYVTQRAAHQQQALMAYAEIMADYQKAFQQPELWQDVALASQAALRHYSGSMYEPYFIALQSEALIQQDKRADALVLLQQALNKMSASSPLYPLFATKKALLALDSEDAAVQTEGFAALKVLANDNKNQQRDEALYYLYQHYNRTDNQQEAHAVQQQATLLAKSMENSPWIQRIIQQ